MIVLDTNVVSEAMKPEPHASVRAWLNHQAAETLYLSSVTLAEQTPSIDCHIRLPWSAVSTRFPYLFAAAW